MRFREASFAGDSAESCLALEKVAVSAAFLIFSTIHSQLLFCSGNNPTCLNGVGSIKNFRPAKLICHFSGMPDFSFQWPFELDLFLELVSPFLSFAFPLPSESSYLSPTRLKMPSAFSHSSPLKFFFHKACGSGRDKTNLPKRSSFSPSPESSSS